MPCQFSIKPVVWKRNFSIATKRLKSHRKKKTSLNLNCYPKIREQNARDKWNIYLQGWVAANGYSRVGGNRGVGRPGGQW